jgi:hypothetical protein
LCLDNSLTLLVILLYFLFGFGIILLMFVLLWLLLCRLVFYILLLLFFRWLNCKNILKAHLIVIIVQLLIVFLTRRLFFFVFSSFTKLVILFIQHFTRDFRKDFIQIILNLHAKLGVFLTLSLLNLKFPFSRVLFLSQVVLKEINTLEVC